VGRERNNVEEDGDQGGPRAQPATSAGWAKLQEVRATAAKQWTERVWYCYNQRWMRSSNEGTEASRSGSLKNRQEWGKKCFEDLDQRRMRRPATRRWSTDFLLREDRVEKKQGNG